MSKRVLVFGAAGFIGRAISRGLVERGMEVRGLVRRAAKSEQGGVDYRLLEPAGTASLPRLLEDCDLVVHAASSTTPGSSAGRPLLELTENLAPTLALLEALHNRPACRLIYLSSGGTLYGDLSKDLMGSEDSAVQARSYYAAGKAAAEQFVRAWAAQTGGSACLIRPSNVYGPGQSERQGFGIVPRAFGSALRGEAMELWGGGESVRDYLYIDDLVDLCIRVAEAELPSGTTLLNASSGIGTRLADLLGIIQALTGLEVEQVHAPSRPVDVTKVSIDPARAHALFGWRAQVALADGLQRTWAWFKSIQR